MIAHNASKIVLIVSILWSSTSFTVAEARPKQIDSPPEFGCRSTTTDTPLFTQRTTTSQQIGTVDKGGRVLLQESPRKGLQLIAVFEPDSEKYGYIQTKVLDFCDSSNDSGNGKPPRTTACRRIRGIENVQYEVYPEPDKNYTPIATVRSGQVVMVRLRRDGSVSSYRNRDLLWVEIDLYKTPMAERYKFPNGETGWIENQDQIGYCDR
ncbi:MULTISPECIES: hypothetical protein [Nostocales]|uniref:SH3b domain-containing protein n=3 Tax=Nostocales TaxID=1161 RepID=A0A0C1N517_9CYAN|nr:hypothetical protein [Tolypothrix bouteillei]KAF3888974.1 hypothetical protein DA73_0400028445 [Tolypothrix bouteillei VB521301]